MFLPYGFGFIYQEIVATQIGLAGVEVSMSDIPKAMAIPAIGMAVGLACAFIAYRKPRKYKDADVAIESVAVTMKPRNVVFTIIALIAALTVQIPTDSMIMGALSGIMVY